MRTDKNYFGVMLDMSRNGVMKVETVKKFADIIASMGYNMIQLYTEDTFSVKNEPCFGYMRGGYTVDEIREIDSYCAEKGIELIPCIQTLAHLNGIFKWKEYEEINDVKDILLIGSERTYTLIENIFATVAESFTSRRINIGMDEAQMVGLGKYLEKNGYKNRFEILHYHLKRVLDIAGKYGFKPMMWSDMFFRLNSNGNYYSDSVEITDEMKKSVPKNVDLIYWDYYNSERRIYDNMIDGHKELCENVWFAGGAWTWAGFAPFNQFAQKNMLPAMQACREKGIKNIFITLWGDNGKECSFFSVLPTLYYIKKVYDGETDIEKIKQGFKALTGEEYDAFMALDLPNKICGNFDSGATNPCKYVFYADLFNNFTDSALPEGGDADYRKFKSILKKAGKNSEFKYIFDCLESLCDVLSCKYGLGMKIRNAYGKRDKSELRELTDRVGTVIKKVRKFYTAFKNLWFTENKACGFDVQDIRIGGLIQRLESCRERLEKYLGGEIDLIEELETDLISEKEKYFLCINNWAYCVTANSL